MLVNARIWPKCPMAGGRFLASSDAQLLEIRQIEAYKTKLKAKEKGDAAAVQAVENDEKRLKEMSEIFKGGY